MKKLLITQASLALCMGLFLAWAAVIDGTGTKLTRDQEGLALFANSINTSLLMVFLTFGWVLLAKKPTIPWIVLGIATFLLIMNCFGHGLDASGKFAYGFHPDLEVIILKNIPAWIISLVAVLRTQPTTPVSRTH